MVDLSMVNQDLMAIKITKICSLKMGKTVEFIRVSCLFSDYIFTCINFDFSANYVAI